MTLSADPEPALGERERCANARTNANIVRQVQTERQVSPGFHCQSAQPCAGEISHHEKPDKSVRIPCPRYFLPALSDSEVQNCEHKSTTSRFFCSYAGKKLVCEEALSLS